MFAAGDFDGLRAVLASSIVTVTLEQQPDEHAGDTVVVGDQHAPLELRVLNAGADDYMVKPFEADILLSRVRALFRRQERAAAA